MARRASGSGSRASGSRKSSPGTRSRRRSTSRSRGSTRPDKSVEAFRSALERSVTLSRERIQEVVDDAVERGRMTRGDANELVSKLVTRGRSASDELVRDLERLLDQMRSEFGSRTSPARRQATRAASRVGRAAREAADPALAEADKLRRRTGVGSPITAYDQLTAEQVKSRLKDLGAAELRKVRTQEKRGKARKGVLSEIEKRLERK